MSDTSGSDRVSRVCDVCGVEDAQSHHVQHVAFLHPVTNEPTDLSVSRHIQCCADTGCEICSVDVAHAQEAGIDTSGPSDEFTQAMQQKGDVLLAALATVGVANPVDETAFAGEPTPSAESGA
jgi:hypothetical protein